MTAMKVLITKHLTALCCVSVLLFLSITTGACKKAKPQPGQPAVVVNDSVNNILFIGNSLTYTNNLPDIIAGMGRDSGVEIRTRMIAYPNYALEDHWNDGQIQALIATGQYDFVLIQQGPSSQADGRAMLMDYGARIKTLCDRHHATLAFYMVWPALTNFQTFDGVIKNYTDAATATNSLLCPVGQVWKNYFLATGDYSYYGPDEFHPSQKGSECAARVIFQTLFK